MKLENKSKNLREILDAVLEGKTVQFKSNTNQWIDEQVPSTVLYHLDFEWRVKPEPVQEAYTAYIQTHKGSLALPSMSLGCFKAGWEAAMQEKE